MTREEILYKKSKTGTTAFYFVPNITLDMVPFLEEPAYVILDNFNAPSSFHIYSSGTTELWKLESVNGYQTNVQLSSVTTNYLTGYSISQKFNKLIPTVERDTIRQKFNDNVTNIITAQTQVAINYQTYVFFDEHEVDDMFANIKLSRSCDTLDTLKIYNKPINSIPLQEARTGVLFGKLEAIQILKDEVGNNIRIPLRNVPIGIFNPTEEFPAPMSLDSNGDRFFMNIKESANQVQYFDSVAFSEDQKFLKSQSQFTSVPEKFKNVTITDENGEFVIYDAPIGNQIVMFEVDLFKQGLSKDEIILNYFPFPTNDDANIGEFPCYYYNQIPVDVVPAWGTSQTGYTELNISANLDLRKWTTYIFAPAAFGNEKLETTVAKNVTSTLKIQIRDMTNKKFETKILETTQIPNDLDRRSGSKYFWFNEILDQRQQIEFYKFGCHVIKLPANLYDPNGFRTDNNGNPTTQKGLWLSSYQFRTLVNKNRCFRDTGGYLDESGNFWSHFNINYFSGATPSDTNEFAGYGKFPYEKPWTINYPEPYKIAKKPIDKRFDYGSDRRYINPYIVEEPAYLDGDLVGNVVDTNSELANVGGFGVQSFGSFFPNQIAYVATKDYMYKYEKDVHAKEKYANGYEPYWNQSNIGPYLTVPELAGMSSVNNGEKYQRVECGYGYFMKYENWPRVFRVDWSADIYFYPDTSTSPGTSSPGTYFGNFKTLQPWRHNTYNLDDQNFAFAFDQFTNNKTNKGGIDIYRIVESGVDNIKIPESFLIPTAMRLNFGGHADRCYSLYLINNGTIDSKLRNDFNSGTIVVVQNPSGGSLSFSTSQTFTLNPGGIFYVNDSIGGGNSGNERLAAEVEFTAMDLPGNDSFNTATNKYEISSYTIGISVGGPIDGGGNIPTSTGHVDISFSVSATVDKPNWYINSSAVGGASGLNFFGISTFGNSGNDMYSIYFENAPR